jgi:hypothetical protein
VRNDGATRSLFAQGVAAEVGGRCSCLLSGSFTRRTNNRARRCALRHALLPRTSPGDRPREHLPKRHDRAERCVHGLGVRKEVCEIVIKPTHRRSQRHTVGMMPLYTGCTARVPARSLTLGSVGSGIVCPYVHSPTPRYRIFSAPQWIRTTGLRFRRSSRSEAISTG